MSTSFIDTLFLFDKKEEIRCFIQKLLSDKGKDTNYVNKRMQDSIVNFFLEDYVAPLFSLSESYDSSVNRKQFHKNILSNIKQRSVSNLEAASSHKNPKYVQLLCEYLELLVKENLLREYQQMLIKTIMMDESENKESCLTLLWRKQLCILLLEHSMNPLLNNIYLMWNSAYPQNPIYNKKESFYRKNLKQKKVSPLSTSSASVNKSGEFGSHPLSRATAQSVGFKDRSSFEEESHLTLSIVKQEYPHYQMEQEHSSISGSFSTDLRSPRSIHSSKQSSCSLVQKKNTQKRAAVLSLTNCNKRCISFNFEIVQYINSQLSNQTYLSSSIIQLQ